VGLASIGVPREDPRMRRAADWLKSRQNENGAWGESPRTYDEPEFRGFGPATASQTAWAIMGLLAAGEVNSDAVARGVNYLLQTQRPDGTWEEDALTGTAFPRAFYLKSHLHRLYFPLMALARYERLRSGTAAPGLEQQA
jgi:squalene-hopene/tetraprenyl-beta-curcumene cyclase